MREERLRPDAAAAEADDRHMVAVQEGDPARLGVLFERHHRALFNFFLRLTVDRQASEDLVQDVFFRILKYPATYEPGTSFRTWMYHLARNAHIDRFKGRRREALYEDGEGYEPMSQAAAPGRRNRARPAGGPAPRSDGAASRGQARAAGAGTVPGAEGPSRSAGCWVVRRAPSKCGSSVLSGRREIFTGSCQETIDQLQRYDALRRRPIAGRGRSATPIAAASTCTSPGATPVAPKRKASLRPGRRSAGCRTRCRRMRSSSGSTRC